MNEYIELFIKTYTNYANYLWKTVKNPFPDGDFNFFYFVIFISLAVWTLELITPWRKEQKAFRKDFWLDGFYMFFNFFIFILLLYIALSSVTVQLMNDLLASLGYKGGDRKS